MLEKTSIHHFMIHHLPNIGRSRNRPQHEPCNPHSKQLCPQLQLDHWWQYTPHPLTNISRRPIVQHSEHVYSNIPNVSYSVFAETHTLANPLSPTLLITHPLKEALLYHATRQQAQAPGRRTARRSGPRAIIENPHGVIKLRTRVRHAFRAGHEPPMNNPRESRMRILQSHADWTGQSSIRYSFFFSRL
ncbi:unnamed protein product [Periconia digitata]|uniref:Uncharacterized protein n=1 Tax=Periconia digitata TaxID=1303443 RepID=A0A9W4UP34_9PLEO|nr:unnamed protein product [Periconia digitata]